MPFDFDDRFLDVSFPDDPNFVFGDLGISPFARTFAAYEDSEEMMTDSQCREAAEQQEVEGSLEWLIKRIFDQGQEGSCVGNAGTQGNMVIQAIQFGLENVIDMSAISLYQLIGRSAQSGAMVSAALDAMRDTGIIPLDTPENRARFGNIVMPHRGFKTRRPQGWQEIAKQFLTPEWDIIRTFQGLKTAAAKRKPIIVGREGHSILYIGLRWANRFLFPYVNSWRESWGMAMANFTGGFGIDSESQAKKSAVWAFTPRVGTIPDYRMAA